MPPRVEASVEIEAPVETVYGYWQTLENLSRFMTDVDVLLTEVREFSHWTLYGSFDATVEFNALTTLDEADPVIGRQPVESLVGPSGSVRFEEPGPDRTRVEVTMDYTGPRRQEVGGAAGVGDPRLMLDRYLWSLKNSLEARTTPREIQSFTPTATARSELAAFIAGGVGSALLTGVASGIVSLLARRVLAKRAAGKTSASDGKARKLPGHRSTDLRASLRRRTASNRQ